MGNAHTAEQRAFIVRALAQFYPPPRIAADFAGRWRDTACTIEDVNAHDPRFGVILPPELDALFKVERERILVNPYAAPTADQRVRLIELHRMFEEARDRSATSLAAELLEQIATETGGSGGKGGKGGAPAGLPEVREITVKRTIVYPAGSKPDGVP